MKKQRNLLSNPQSTHHNVATPRYILEFMRELLGDNYFDPCPLVPSFDGLTVPWKGSVYCNPPYDNIDAWMRKAIKEVRDGACSACIMLVPFKAHCNYWDELVLPHAWRVDVITSPIIFDGYKQKMPQVMCLVHYAPRVTLNTLPQLCWLEFPQWKQHCKCNDERRMKKSYDDTSNKLKFLYQ
jgi:hypothetical protein